MLSPTHHPPPPPPIYIPSRTWQAQQLLLRSQRSCGVQEVGRGKHTCRGRQTCARAAAVQPETDAQPGARSIAARMPHAEVWELFCDARKAAGAFEQSSACVPKATDIITRIERVVAELAATVASAEGQESILRSMKHHRGELPEPLVPIESELDLAAFYKDIKTSPLPELVPPLRAGLSHAEQAVFPSCNNPGSTFKGWGTLASPDDLHILTGNGRVKELEACADAGFLLENSMHDSSRDADDGLMCSMYDVLRLYVILNQLLHNEWDVLECLQWPSDESLPEAAQGLLNAKSTGIKTQGRRADRFAAMPPEPLMKLIVGSQLHWVASITAGVEGGEGVDATASESVKPQFARSQAWLEMGSSVRERTVTSEDVRVFCEEQLLPTLVTTEYMLAYDRRRCSGALPLPVGEDYWEEFVCREGCWRVGSVAYQVLHLDMRLEALRPRRGWGGYEYYNDRAPLQDSWFTAGDQEA